MKILILTDRDGFEQAWSGLRVLGNSVTRRPRAASRAECRGTDAVLVDGNSDVAVARESCRKIGAWEPSAAVLAVAAAEDFSAVGLHWHVDDVLIATAGPTEADARLRLAVARRHQSAHQTLQFGPLIIHPESFTASLSNRDLDLTLTEFKLLNYLVQHAGQAFTRARLLHELWGGKGGRRKVDVHVQRLRAKLGTDHESIVDTVRGVGYMTPELPQPHWTIAT